MLTAALFVAAALSPSRGASDPPQPASDAFRKLIKPSIEKYCVRCHGTNGAGGVDLSQYPDATSLQRNPDVWRKVVHQLKTRNMPPIEADQPTPEEAKSLIDSVSATIEAAAPDSKPTNPGRVTIHRLSRTEYNNTIRDMLGVDTHPADSFPADGGGGSGFDNNADTLFIPPILMERYLAAAADCIGKTRSERILFIKPGNGVTKAAAARTILARYAMLGYRRPVETAEIDRLLALYQRAEKRGVGFEGAVRYALTAILVSPKFLFRVEATPPGYRGGAHAISDYELASRLSYFLWSSMPDKALFDLAANKTLHLPKVLDAQVSRMLQDPKAHAFAESFAGQWLRIRDLYTSAQPDPNRFPVFTPALRDAMYNETIDFVQSVFHDNRSLTDLIDSDYTYLNQDLAKHYGIDGVTGSQMRRVSLADHKRGGVLTMASVLTITSYAERTSPVLRGKWVLEQVLGSPPPPPPPNAGGLSQDDSVQEGLTFRQRLEKHRGKPQCASCHNSMDPIGFGLENFDAIGRWRGEIGGKAVDSSGVLADGSKFNGPVELKQHISAARGEFVRNLTEKMLGYSLGRGLEEYDRITVRQIADRVTANGYQSGTLIREIVKSYPFLYRTDSPAAGPQTAAGRKVQ